MHSETASLRIIGFLVSLLLTLGAYFIIIYPEFFHLDTEMAIAAILILAILQFIAQFIFFIKLWREKGPPWNLGVFVSTLSIILIIVLFSIWIMNRLNYNMMPP